MPSRTKRVARPKTTAQRGYGNAHKKRREQYKTLVAAGKAICWRCDEPIDPNGPWDLGHDDHDRTQYRGPEHVTCNRGAPNRGTTTERAVDTSRPW